MMYLIGQLGPWLLLTAAFSALAGWAYAAWRAAPGEAMRRRERERLLRDLTALSGGGADAGASAELERELDLLRRRAGLDASRVAELERLLEAARARAEEAAGRIAELERAPGQSDEVARLRGELELLQREQARMVEVQAVAEAAPPEPDEASVLQTWRLRYFEQRVRYLEGMPPPAPVEAPPAPALDPTWEWRARTAEARVAHLEDEIRAAAEAPAPSVVESEEPPFAANAETDMMLRWRMLYLEKRTGYLESERAAARAEAERNALDYDEAETWKWRTRYLEARTRHLDGRIAALSEEARRPQTALAPAPVAPSAAFKAERPPSLPAPRGGAPDDFRLIEGVSALQQNTLYSLGVYHFDQVAAWTPANVAWIDAYLRLRGRIEEEEWVEQAADLARDGVAAARGAQVEEEA